MHRQEENLTENHTISVVSEIDTNNKEENSSLFMENILQKGKTKVETSSLRNLKMMPGSLNEIVLS
jgi:hypothetical protein